MGSDFLNPSGQWQAGQVDANGSQKVIIDSTTPGLSNVSVSTDIVDFTPRYEAAPGGVQNLQSDPDGNLMVRGNVTTDERSFRCNFSGNTLLGTIGTCTFVNGSDTVTTTGDFTTHDVHVGNYIKLDAHAEEYLAQVDAMTPTTITLTSPYQGASGTGLASAAQVKYDTPTGGSLVISNGVAVINMGTTAGSVGQFERDVDILPMLMQTGAIISQRIANQDIYIGFYDEQNEATPHYYTWFHFSGTDDSKVVCESSFSRYGVPTGYEIETTTVQIPFNSNTASLHRYRLELTGYEAIFYIDDIKVARHTKAMPRPVDLLTACVKAINGTTPATNTAISVDYITVNNYDRFDVGFASQDQNRIPLTSNNQVAVAIASEIQRFNDGFNAVNTNLWDVTTGSGDIVEAAGNTGGAEYVKISKDPTKDNTETILLSKFAIPYSMRAIVGASLSQRVAHQQFMIEFIGVDSSFAVENSVAPTAISTTLNQTTTTATVDCGSAHGLVSGDRISLYGHADSKANYCDAIVATTPTALQFTFTSTVLGTITSNTITNATGFFIKLCPLSWAKNGFSLAFDGTTAANAQPYSKSNAGSYKTATSAAIGTTAATQANSNNFTDSFIPAHQYDFRLRPSELVVRGMPVSNTTVQSGSFKITDVIPEPSKLFKIRIRCKNHISASRIVADIVSISKAGSTTWTVTTRANHNLVTNNWVAIYGNRDTTNFANVTTPVQVTVTGPTTFTMVSTTGTATGYGGVVVLVNGAVFSGATPASPVLQSLSRTSNQMSCVFSATMASAVVPGETVSLLGVTSDAGADLSAYQGVYKVLSVATTTVILASTGDDFVSVNAGGSLIKRTDFRLHFLRLFNYNRSMVDIEGGIGDSGDIQDSVPVSVTSSASLTVTATNLSCNINQIAAGTPITVSAQGATNKAMAVMVSGSTNSTLTTTAFAGSGATNGATQAISDGGMVAAGFDISVTTLTLGTATSVLFSIEESYDNGTTYSAIWTSQPVTATGHIRVPPLNIIGRLRMRAWSVGGTSTTVTCATNIMEYPAPVLTQRQMCDVYAATNPFTSMINGTSYASTLVSTSQGTVSAVALVEGCKNITISGVFTGGTPSTNPTYSLQLSQDATNWFTTSTTITPTAAGTFMATLAGTCARFARLIVTTASSGGTPYGVTYTCISGVN